MSVRETEMKQEEKKNKSGHSRKMLKPTVQSHLLYDTFQMYLT